MNFTSLGGACDSNNGAPAANCHLTYDKRKKSNESSPGRPEDLLAAATSPGSTDAGSTAVADSSEAGPSSRGISSNSSLHKATTSSHQDLSDLAAAAGFSDHGSIDIPLDGTAPADFPATVNSNFSTAAKVYPKFSGWNKDLYSNVSGFGPPARKSSSPKVASSKNSEEDPSYGLY